MDGKERLKCCEQNLIKCWRKILFTSNKITFHEVLLFFSFVRTSGIKKRGSVVFTSVRRVINSVGRPSESVYLILKKAFQQANTPINHRGDGALRTRLVLESCAVWNLLHSWTQQNNEQNPNQNSSLKICSHQHQHRTTNNSHCLMRAG